MKISSRSVSLVAAVMGAIIIAPIQPPRAEAASALTNNALSVSSGSIKVFATTSQTFTSTGVTLSTSIANGTAKTFFVNNGGSLMPMRFTMIISLPKSANISSFRRCGLNIAFTGANTCASGSSTAITFPGSGSASIYELLLPGTGFYSFQIVQNKTGTMTVDTLVSLSDVPVGLTNS